MYIIYSSVPFEWLKFPPCATICDAPDELYELARRIYIFMFLFVLSAKWPTAVDVLTHLDASSYVFPRTHIHLRTINVDIPSSPIRRCVTNGAAQSEGHSMVMREQLYQMGSAGKHAQTRPPQLPPRDANGHQQHNGYTHDNLPTVSNANSVIH